MTGHVFPHAEDMYLIDLEKHYSRKSFLDKNFLPEDNKTLSDETISYSLQTNLILRAQETYGHKYSSGFTALTVY